jgi:hypothetical protein
VTDAKLRRTIRRSVALLLLPLSVGTDAVLRLATEEYFVGTIPLASVVPPFLFLAAVLYLFGSALSGIAEPPEDGSDPEDPDGSTPGDTAGSNPSGTDG